VVLAVIAVIPLAVIGIVKFHPPLHDAPQWMANPPKRDEFPRKFEIFIT
jgi:hypothetical protein